MGYINLSGLTSQLQPGAVTPTSRDQVVTVGSCGDDNLADLQLRARNSINTSTTADYVITPEAGTALALVDAKSNSVIATYGTGGSTFSSSANILECGKEYYLAVVNNASVAAMKTKPFIVDNSIIRLDVDVQQSAELNFNLFTLAYVNETSTTTAFATGSQDFASVTNNAMDQNSVISYRYEYRVATTSSQFGSTERLCETETGVCGRAFVCITGASSVYAEGDLEIAGSDIVGKTSSLPARCRVVTPTNAGVGRAAYETNVLKNSGLKSGTLSITASLGTPGDTNNVQFLWMDNGYYQANDGTVAVGTADQGGTSIGETDRYFQIDIT